MIHAEAPLFFMNRFSTFVNNPQVPFFRLAPFSWVQRLPPPSFRSACFFFPLEPFPHLTFFDSPLLLALGTFDSLCPLHYGTPRKPPPAIFLFRRPPSPRLDMPRARSPPPPALKGCFFLMRTSLYFSDRGKFQLFVFSYFTPFPPYTVLP